MAQVSDTHVAAARRMLLQQRAAENVEWASAAGNVYDALSRELSPVIGSAGMRALFARCLKLNRADFPELAAVSNAGDPRQESAAPSALVATLDRLERARAEQAATALFATFFALLTTFIGERLTWQIVQRAFSEGGGTASKETK